MAVVAELEGGPPPNMATAPDVLHVPQAQEAQEMNPRTVGVLWFLLAAFAIAATLWSLTVIFAP